MLAQRPWPVVRRSSPQLLEQAAVPVPPQAADPNLPPLVARRVWVRRPEEARAVVPLVLHRHPRAMAAGPRERRRTRRRWHDDGRLLVRWRRHRWRDWFLRRGDRLDGGCRARSIVHRRFGRGHVF